MSLKLPKSKYVFVVIAAAAIALAAACGNDSAAEPLIQTVIAPQTVVVEETQVVNQTVIVPATLVVPATVVSTVVVIQTATPAPASKGIAEISQKTTRAMTLNGAGATFPFVLYSKLFDEYNKLNTGIKVNYQSIGSGGGIRQISEKTVDFGASDAVMTDAQKATAAGHLLHFPMTMGAVVATYNLPGNLQLQFTPAVLAGIFLGKIKSWDDPRIATDNPGVTLPSTQITVVHRSDGSGTTFVFTDYLTNVSAEWASKVGKATSVQWPAGLGASGNSGVAGQVGQITGAIGYVELIYAIQNKLGYAKIQNKEGQWILPTLESVTEAAGAKMAAGGITPNLEVSIVNGEGATSYPISTFTWLLIYDELSVLPTMTQERAEETVRFMIWSLDPKGGQQYSAPLGYAPLDPAISNQALANIKNIKFKGKAVWEAMAAQ